MEKRIMSVHSGRLIASCFTVVAAASVSTASAQVTLHLTTPQQTTCTVITDAQGLSLVPGTTDLQATGVTFSGSACSGIPAPTPPNFALSAPGTVTTLSAFTVNWSVTGATSCAGHASLNGNSANLAGWTDATSATPPRSVTAPIDGTYTLTMTCSNSGGSVTSAPATVVASTGGGGNPDNCPNPQNRLTTSAISYVPSGSPPTRTNVNMTSWDEIWGHATSTDTPAVPFPGRSNSQPTILNFGRTQYLAAKFHVPANAVPGTTYGWITHTEYNYGVDLTATISPNCGDFNDTSDLPPVCVVVGALSGQQIVPWRVALLNSNFCQVTAGQDYFLNIRPANPTQGTTTCAASAPQCKIGTSNNTHVP
jgi:hypothetical protein